MTKLAEALIGNTNAAGKHMMKLSSELLDVTKTGAHTLSHAAAEFAKDAEKSLTTLSSNVRHKVSDEFNQMSSSAGIKLHNLAHQANDAANNIRAKLPSKTAITQTAKLTAKPVPVIKHVEPPFSSTINEINKTTEMAKAVVERNRAAEERAQMQETLKQGLAEAERLKYNRLHNGAFNIFKDDRGFIGKKTEASLEFAKKHDRMLIAIPAAVLAVNTFGLSGAVGGYAGYKISEKLYPTKKDKAPSGPSKK